MSEVTVLLASAADGDSKAAKALWTLVYDELHRMARGKIACEQPGQTLAATDLVHEAYLRLVGDQSGQWENSRHFFCAAAEAMRRILIDRARRKRRIKRGGELKRIALDDLDDIDVPAETNDETLLLVHEALEVLARKDPECAELIKLRFFGGCSHEEAGKILGFSEKTARRNWIYSRAVLRKEILRLTSGGESAPG
jgi:RNA polymerase sigma factor (TIGR02999 family)